MRPHFSIGHFSDVVYEEKALERFGYLLCRLIERRRVAKDAGKPFPPISDEDTRRFPEEAYTNFDNFKAVF
jgi:hypothetical protein